MGPKPQQAPSLATPSTPATSTRSCPRLAETLPTSERTLLFRPVQESTSLLVPLPTSRSPPLPPPSTSQLSRATLMPRARALPLPLALTNQLLLRRFGCFHALHVLKAFL